MSMNSISPSLHTYQLLNNYASEFRQCSGDLATSNWRLPTSFADMAETLSKYAVQMTRSDASQLGTLLINGRKALTVDVPRHR